HTFVRRITLGMLGFGCITVVGMAIAGVANGEIAGILVVPVFALMALAIARTTLRAQPVFGDERGLWVRQFGKWRAIPWKDVEDVDYPISSMNPHFRVYRIWIKGDHQIRFMPDAEHLAAIERFRRDAK